MELRTAKSQKPRLRTAITNATTLGITSPGLSSPSLYSLGFLVVKICHRHVVCTDYLAHGIHRDESLLMRCRRGCLSFALRMFVLSLFFLILNLCRSRSRSDHVKWVASTSSGGGQGLGSTSSLRILRPSLSRRTRNSDCDGWQQSWPGLVVPILSSMWLTI